MLGTYLPIMLLILIALAFGLGSVVFSSLIGQKKYSKVKMAPYECGCEPIGTHVSGFQSSFTDRNVVYSVRY
jgi:NADH-quinone oxidoreductase subunit A